MDSRTGSMIRIPFTSVEVKKPILVTYLLCTIHNVAFFTQIIGMPYIAKRLHVNDTLFGHSQTLFGVLSILGGPVFGFLMKKYGMKRSLYVVYFMTMLMALILICFYNVYGLFISKLPAFLLHGMQVHQAMLAALTEPGKERTTAFGKIGLCFGLSFVIAPMINKLSSVFFNEFAALYSSIFLALFSMVLAHYLVDENEYKRAANGKVEGLEKDESEKVKKEESKPMSIKTVYEISKKENVLTVFLQKNLAVASMHIPLAVLQLFLIEKFDVSESGNSVVQMVVGVLIMVVNGIGIPFLRHRFAETKLVFIGIVCLLIVHAQLVQFVYLQQLYLILPFLALGMTLVNTVSDSILTASVEHDEQSIVLGVCTAAASTGRTIAPSIGGYILDKYGFSTIGYMGLATTLMSLGIAVVAPAKNLKGADEENKADGAKDKEL